MSQNARLFVSDTIFSYAMRRFNARDNPLAAQAIRLTSQSLKSSPRWREIQQIESPYGQVCMYTFNGH